MPEKAFVDQSTQNGMREFPDHLGGRWRAHHCSAGWSLYQLQDGRFVFIRLVGLEATATCFQLWDRANDPGK